MSIVKEGSAM